MKRRIWFALGIVVVATSILLAPFDMISRGYYTSFQDRPALEHSTKWLPFWTKESWGDYKEGAAFEDPAGRRSELWAAQVCGTVIVVGLFAVVASKRRTPPAAGHASG